VKRGFVVAVGGAAIVIAGLSGCSSGEKKTESTVLLQRHPAHRALRQLVRRRHPAGRHQGHHRRQGPERRGHVVCTAMGGNMNIAIGEAATGIAAVVSEDASKVTSVGLGNVNNVTLAYAAAAGQGDAKASKDGNTWTISGTATGVDMANPMQPVNKPFEIVVTCP